jgi:hypothetical protein
MDKLTYHLVGPLHLVSKAPSNEDCTGLDGVQVTVAGHVYQSVDGAVVLLEPASSITPPEWIVLLFVHFGDQAREEPSGDRKPPEYPLCQRPPDPASIPPSEKKCYRDKPVITYYCGGGSTIGLVCTHSPAHSCLNNEWDDCFNATPSSRLVSVWHLLHD